MKFYKDKANDIEISYGDKKFHKDYWKRGFLYNKILSTEITDDHVFIREYFANYSNYTYLTCRFCLYSFLVDEDDYCVNSGNIDDYKCSFSAEEKMIKDIIE